MVKKRGGEYSSAKSVPPMKVTEPQRMVVGASI